MQTSRPALVISIHDVSPLTQPVVQQMLADLSRLGVERTSLLVIPNHHHRAPISENESFCIWAAEMQAAGHEIVMHGFFHQRPPGGGGLVQSLVTEQYTSGEGEFFDLPEAEATRRLVEAQALFREKNFRSPGFIAPAWLLGQEAEAAVKKIGFEYTTRLGNIKDLRFDKVTVTQSLVWSVRAGWRRTLSLGWNALLAQRLSKNPVMRVGLHPPDWNFPSIRAQVLRLIGAALARREAITYEEWLLRDRAAQ